MDNTRRSGSWARGLTIGVVVLVATSAATLRAQSGGADEREAPEVRGLTLQGVKHVDPDDLKRSISTQASHCRSLLLTPFCLVSNSPTWVEKHYLDRDELRRDVLRIRVYYWKRGYRDAQVDTSITPAGRDGVRVRFAITEGPPTRVALLRVEYDSTLMNLKRVRRLSLLKGGAPLDLIALDSMRLMFETEMWNLGYSDARVDTAIAVHPAQHTADVLLRVAPNWKTTVGSIVIRGNQRVDESTIRNTITLHEGDAFRRRDLLQSQRSLYETNLFRMATILPPTGDSVKHLEIQVIEAPLHDTELGFGLNSVDFLQLSAQHTNFNLLGGARRLDLTGSLGNLMASSLNGRGIFRDVVQDVPGAERAPYLQPTWAASVDFNQPAFLRQPPNQFGVGVFSHRRSLPGVYIDRGYGATATFTRQFRDRAPGSLNYRYEITRVEASDVYFCVDYGICDTLTIHSLRRHQSLSPLALTGFVDRSDSPLNPTNGYLARINIEHASSVTLSDYRYNRAFADVATYWHRGTSKSVLAAHLRLGIVRPMGGGASAGTLGVLHPRKRFYAGGAQSVRGYGENQLGPRILTVDPGSLVADSVRTTSGALCDAALVRSPAVSECDPNTGHLSNGSFTARPLGGTSLVEGSVEFRFPLMERYKLQGAVFVDGAMLGESSLKGFQDLRRLANGTGAITPGFGVRYISPVGPIRIDFGIKPTLAEDLTVVTEVPVNGKSTLVPLTRKRTYSDAGRGFLSRLMLHFSIGQAY